MGPGKEKEKKTGFFGCQNETVCNPGPGRTKSVIIRIGFRIFQNLIWGGSRGLNTN